MILSLQIKKTVSSQLGGDPLEANASNKRRKTRGKYVQNHRQGGR